MFGLRLLRQARRAHEERPDVERLDFERTAELVTSGIFRSIRHPMYSSLLFLAWGVFFKAPSGPGSTLALAAIGRLVATAKTEERENVRNFGPTYESYVRRAKVFVPYMF